MKDTKGTPAPLPQGDQEILDDFKRRWNDSHAQLHPLVDISPDGIDALFHEAETRRHTQAVRHRRTAYSFAASVALLIVVGGTLYRQLPVDRPVPLIAENVMEEPIPSDIAPQHFRHSEPVDAPQVHQHHTTSKPLNSQLSTLNSQLPDAAPQDISAPLSNIEEKYMETQPIERLRCNSQCDYNMLAMLIDGIALEEGGMA